MDIDDYLDIMAQKYDMNDFPEPTSEPKASSDDLHPIGSIFSIPDKKNASTAAFQTLPQPAKRAVSSVSKRPPGSSYKEVVTVEIGPGKKAFVIHKDLLVFYSDYFHGAFNGSFKEATEGRISLPDEREDDFDIFNQFIYSCRLADGEGHKLTWDQLIRVWLLGDKFFVPALQNSTMDALMRKSDIRNFIATDRIKFIWENTLPSSPLRKLILDQVVYDTDVDNFLSAREEFWTREALVELAIALYRKEPTTRKYQMPFRGSCHYHIHSEGERC